MTAWPVKADHAATCRLRGVHSRTKSPVPTYRDRAGARKSGTDFCSSFSLPSQDLLLAIDVEYLHAGSQGANRTVVHAAEVCLVDNKLDVAYHSYIQTEAVRKQDRRGGVEWEHLRKAPNLTTVRSELRQILNGIAYSCASWHAVCQYSDLMANCGRLY